MKKIKKKHFKPSNKDKKNKKMDIDENDSDGIDDDISDQEAEEFVQKWYDQFVFQKFDSRASDENIVQQLRPEAEMILEDEIKIYKSRLESSKNTEIAWRMKIAKCGTSADKIAALTLLVQESPVHNLFALKSLISMANVSKKHQYFMVIDTLVELFLSDLLRPGKKLKRFHKQPLAHLGSLSNADNSVRRKILCYWLFEDQLKEQYEHFLRQLNDAAHDSVQSNREKAITAMSRLLLENREQEQTLLVNLINKLGDPVHKVASKVVYGLEKVMHKYPGMKMQMLTEVEKMLFRSHVAQKAQYYGVCFLSQYKLSSSDSQLAKDLIILYFSFFKACVKTGTIDSRLMGALLVGVNRAYPFASRGKKSDQVIPPEHINTMYKVVHLATFKIGLQALALLLQVSNNDRFYNALYKKLLDKEIMNTSHQSIWLNLVFKALNKDSNMNRIKSFVKRILQISLYFPVSLTCGTLLMLSHLTKRWPELLNNFTFIDGEKITTIPKEEPITIDEADDSEEERYFDVKTEDDEEFKDPPELEVKVQSSWYHRILMPTKMETVFEEEEESQKNPKFKPKTNYDPLYRNPAYAGGEYAVMSELLILSEHFHPTVSLFARTLLNRQFIHYTGDPLRDFTLVRFLERFSFKNPKKRREEGGDKEELFRSVGSERKHYIAKGLRALPVQSDYYLNQSESVIPADELYLYRYLREKRDQVKQSGKRGGKDGDDDDSDVESIGSVEFNEYLDSVMNKKTIEDLDFADDVGSTRAKNKISQKSKKSEEEEEGEETDDMDSENEADLDEEEIEDYEDGDLYDDDGDDNAQEFGKKRNMEESEDEEEDDMSDDISLGDISESEEDEEDSKLPLKEAIKKKIGKNFSNFAVPTEKFAALIEEAGQRKSGGFHDVSNKDNAGEKQLRWEASRTNQNWRTSKRKPYKGIYNRIAKNKKLRNEKN